MLLSFLFFHLTSGCCFNWSRMPRIRLASLAFLLNLVLKSHSLATRSHSLPSVLLPTQATSFCSSFSFILLKSFFIKILFKKKIKFTYCFDELFQYVLFDFDAILLVLYALVLLILFSFFLLQRLLLLRDVFDLHAIVLVCLILSNEYLLVELLNINLVLDYFVH